MKYAVLGNCQSGAISAMLDHLLPSWEKVPLIAVHLITKSNDEKMLDAISTVDVLVHQPISDSFGFFSIDALKCRFPHIKFISFPNIYFSGYFSSLMYLRKPKGGTLPGVVGDYHDKRVIEGYLKGSSVSEIMNDMKCPLEYSNGLVLRSITQLKDRESSLDIKISKYIEDNYLKRQLFYSFNHPCNELLELVAREVCRLIGEPEIDKSFPREYLANFIFPIDASIKNELINPQCFYSDYSLVNSLGDKVNLSMEEFIEQSIELYSNVGDFFEVCNFNKNRN
ncbi:TPA: hypothetical protein NKA12_001429 [Vibrio parahaemolyticus]|nr:hypothetical protein [Vibrio parahaemolyticus]HCG8652520.1 hypothetical protein [Vibrio parahaemolyticus]